MLSSSRGWFVAALTLLAVLAFSTMVCLQAQHVFQVSMSTDVPGVFAFQVRPHGVVACVLRLLSS
jgi:hypothetical protein